MGIFVIDDFICVKRDFVKASPARTVFPNHVGSNLQVWLLSASTTGVPEPHAHLVTWSQYQQRRTRLETHVREAIGKDGTHLFEFTGNMAGVLVTAVTEHSEVRTADFYPALFPCEGA
jgi:hypothetical protein